MPDDPKPPRPFEPRVAAAAIFRELVRIREALERLSPPPAPKVDLDTPRGDPKVRLIPRDWKGDQRFKGGPMSEAPPELLDLLAETLEYFANNPKPGTDRKKITYDRLDAARARAWAKRKREGWTPPEKPASSTSAPGAPPPAVQPPRVEPPRVTPPTVETPIADDDFPFGALAPDGSAEDSTPIEDDELPTFE